MSDVCPSCHLAALSTDGERTCLNCGFVVIGGVSNLVQDKVAWAQSYSGAYGAVVVPKTHLNRHLFTTVAKGQTLGRKLITRVGLRLSCTVHMIDEAKTLYDRVFNHDNFRSRRLKTKSVLAAASFYIVCRQFEWAVTLHDIAAVAQCSVFDLDRGKKEILETFGLEIKSVDVLELARARTEKANLDNDTMTATEDVIKLCRKLWISEGRNPENIVSAACFVAWQGQEPSMRLKTNFRAFCKLFKFAFTKNNSVIIGLIQSVLCELAKQIPWVVAGSINSSQVALHLKDIIRYQNTLIAGATADESCGDESDSNSSEGGVSSGNESGSTSHSVSDVKPHLPSASTTQYDSSFSHSADPNGTVKSGKRLSKNFFLFSKRRKVAHAEVICKEEERVQSTTTMNLDGEELGNHDIPDDELHLFIKSETEILNESLFLKKEQENVVSD